MRTGILFLSSAIAALGLVAATPSASEACCCCGWGWGGGYGYGRGYGYAPAYYAPPQAHYPAARPMPMAPPQQAATSVSAKDDVFDPATVNIKPGTTIRFVNNGKHAHTVTSDDGKFDSGDIPPGGVFQATFMSPGTYRYHCKHHKDMKGTIVVGEPGPGPGKKGTDGKGKGKAGED